MLNKPQKMEPPTKEEIVGRLVRRLLKTFTYNEIMNGKFII